MQKKDLFKYKMSKYIYIKKEKNYYSHFIFSKTDKYEILLNPLNHKQE